MRNIRKDELTSAFSNAEVLMSSIESDHIELVRVQSCLDSLETLNTTLSVSLEDDSVVAIVSVQYHSIMRELNLVTPSIEKEKGLSTHVGKAKPYEPVEPKTLLKTISKITKALVKYVRAKLDDLKTALMRLDSTGKKIGELATKFEKEWGEIKPNMSDDLRGVRMAGHAYDAEDFINRTELALMVADNYVTEGNSLKVLADVFKDLKKSYTQHSVTDGYEANFFGGIMEMLNKIAVSYTQRDFGKLLGQISYSETTSFGPAYDYEVFESDPLLSNRSYVFRKHKLLPICKFTLTRLMKTSKPLPKILPCLTGDDMDEIISQLKDMAVMISKFKATQGRVREFQRMSAAAAADFVKASKKWEKKHDPEGYGNWARMTKDVKYVLSFTSRVSVSYYTRIPVETIRTAKLTAKYITLSLSEHKKEK